MGMREGYTCKLPRMMSGLGTWYLINEACCYYDEEEGCDSYCCHGGCSSSSFKVQGPGIFMSPHSRKFGSETHLFKSICLLVPFSATSDKAYLCGNGRVNRKPRSHYTHGMSVEY